MKECIARAELEKARRVQFNVRLPQALINHIKAKAKQEKCSQAAVMIKWGAADMAAQAVDEVTRGNEV